MIKLKTPLIIDDYIVKGLNTHKNVLIYSSSKHWFIIIREFQIEEKLVVKTRWSWFRKITVTTRQPILTDATILIWNSNRKVWTVLSESGIRKLLYYDDIFGMRNFYLDNIKAPLETLGVLFKKQEVNE